MNNQNPPKTSRFVAYIKNAFQQWAVQNEVTKRAAAASYWSTSFWA